VRQVDALVQQLPGGGHPRRVGGRGRRQNEGRVRNVRAVRVNPLADVLEICVLRYGRAAETCAHACIHRVKKR
jgi:hypothetical protein